MRICGGADVSIRKKCEMKVAELFWRVRVCVRVRITFSFAILNLPPIFCHFTHWNICNAYLHLCILPLLRRPLRLWLDTDHFDQKT